MDIFAAAGNCFALRPGGTVLRHSAAHSLEDGLKGVVHMLRLLQLGLGPFVMETQSGDALLVDDIRADIALGSLVGNLFASSREMDVGAVIVADVILQVPPIALVTP